MRNDFGEGRDNVARILNGMPKMIEYDESSEICHVRRLSLAFLAPNNIIRWPF
jgi:hypothetical protein